MPSFPYKCGFHPGTKLRLPDFEIEHRSPVKVEFQIKKKKNLLVCLKILHGTNNVFYPATLCGILLDWNLVYSYCFGTMIYELPYSSDTGLGNHLKCVNTLH